MRDRARQHGWVVAVAGALALCGCGVPPRQPPASPAPTALSGHEVDAFAALLRLEDTRDADLPALTSLASDGSARVRARDALVLGRLRAPGTAPLLLRLLSDPDTAVAATAAFSLGQLGDTTVAPALAVRLDGTTVQHAPTVAAEAASALGKLDCAVSASALAAWLRGTDAATPGARQAVGAALLATARLHGPPPEDGARRWATSPDPELRWRAAYVLARRAGHRAVPTLETLAADSDPGVRAVAILGLTGPAVDSAGGGSARTLSILRTALHDPDYSVRIGAARVLGTYAQPAAVAALDSAMDAGPPHLGLQAIESLGRLGAAARSEAPALAALALDRAAQVALRRAALASLAMVDSARAISTARDLAGSPAWRLRAEAGATVARLVGQSSDVVGERLRDSDPRVAGATLQALVDAAGDSLRPLRSVLVAELSAGDAILRATALSALAKLADPSTLPALLDAYDRARADSLDDAALAALGALGALRGHGVEPANAFFTRFPRSGDPLVRLRARAVFGDSAAGAWGAPLPVATGRSPVQYHEIVERWVAPAITGGPDPEIEIVTDAGTIRLRLFVADAPLTVLNLLDLARRGYFSGQEWPRVVPNFVVQGGDPRGDTSGGPGYTIRDELNRQRYGVGTLGMALSGPDTGGSQFFITLSPQPHLDGTYTAFGEVVAGQSVADRVLPGDRILAIRRVP